MATIRGNTQIIDHSINLVKLESDFLNGANWDITNGTNTATITGLADPTNNRDVANKQYVDSLIQGIQGQFVARVKAQANVAALTGAQTIDGVALVDGDNILLADQTTVSEDGLYTVRTGVWERVSGWEVGDNVGAFFVFVEEGSDDNKGFVCTNDKGSDVVGTDDLTFVQFSGAGAIGAGAGLTQNGSDIDVVATDLSINVNANDIGVNIGTDNGDSLEVTTTGLELRSTITGTRSFTTGGTDFNVTTGAGDVAISGTDVGVSGTGNVSLVGSAQTNVGLFLSGDTNLNGFNLNLKDNEVENSANTTGIPLAITATVNYGNGNGTNVGDVIDQFRTDFTDEGILNAICQVKAELDTYTVTTANGISNVSGVVELGGPLTKSTSIDANYHDLTYSGNNDTTNYYEVINFGVATGGELSDFNIVLNRNFQADVSDFIVNGSNVSFGTTQNSYTIGQTPDGTVPLAIATTQYVDNQVSAAATRKYNNTTTLNIGNQTATLTTAPTTGFVNGVVYLNGLRQILTTDYTVTNAATGEITFTASQTLTAGDIVIMDYSDQ